MSFYSKQLYFGGEMRLKLRLTVGSSPHVKHNDSIQIMMGDVLVALLPIIVMSVFYYGVRAAILTGVSILSCVIFEYLYTRILRKPRSINDLSAVVTGILIACNIPATAPLWFPAVGAFFGIIVVKQLFGGIGKNVFNPAVAAIVFLNVTWQGIMSIFPMPFATLPWLNTPQGFLTKQTALASLSQHFLPANTINELFLGNRPGFMGSGAIIVILVAGLYLLYRRIINFQVPFAFVGTVALLAYIFPRSPSGQLSSMLYEILSGSLIFVAIFMATDPTTSPVTTEGRLLYGFLCGLLTVFLRYNGIYPEGAFFALLLMNPFAKSLDILSWKLNKRGAVNG
jgi:electron transport complex protein RnfD